VVAGGSQFDYANRKYVTTIGEFLSHGYQWNRSIYMRGARLWTYSPDDNEWTDCLPEYLYNREAEGLDSANLGKQNVAAAYADEHQVTYFFAGTGNAGAQDNLHYYDPYTNTLTDTSATNSPAKRNHAGLSWDSSRNVLYMYGSQYRDTTLGGPPYLADELTWTYTPSTNAWTSADLDPHPPGFYSFPSPVTGTATSTSAGKLVDSGASFQTDNVHGGSSTFGDIAYNITDDTSATITSVDSENQLTLSSDIFESSEEYQIYRNGSQYASVPVMRYDPIHDIHVLVAYIHAQGSADANIGAGSKATWKYDPTTATWSEIGTTEINSTDQSLVRTTNMSFSTTDNKFYATSQFTDDYKSTVENRIWTFRAEAGGSWEDRPPAPTITTDADSVLVSWTEIPGTDTYKVYRATGNIPRTYSEVEETADTSYDDEDVTPGTIYFYRYTSINDEVESKQSYFARSQPEVMAAPIVSARSDNDVDVSWTAHTATDVAGYNIYRGKVTVHTNTTIMEVLPFNNGTDAFVADETVSQGAVTATVKYVTVESGSWVGDDAAGYLSILGRSGTFSAGAITGSIAGAANATGASTKIDADAKWYQTTYDGHSVPAVYMFRNVENMTKLNMGGLIETTSYHDDDADLNADVPEESADYDFKVWAYVIRAVNDFGVESGPSPFATTVPSSVKSVWMDNPTETLTWDAAPEDSITGYNVFAYARTESGGMAPVNKVNTELITGTTYTLPEGAYSNNFDRFWVVSVDVLGQEGIPSVPIWYGDNYAGFYTLEDEEPPAAEDGTISYGTGTISIGTGTISTP